LETHFDKSMLAKSKLESLREDDLEAVAKWLSTLHEDLIEGTLEELVGLRGEEARNNYRNHGFENFIKTLDWSYNEKALMEVRELGHEVKPETAQSNLLIFIGERLKNALKPYANCFKRAALIVGNVLAGIPTVPRPEDLSVFLPEDLRKSVVESLGDALRECDVDHYLLVGNEIPPLITGLAYTFVLTEAFVDKYNEAIGEVNRILNIARGRHISDADRFYGLGLASIIVKAVESGKSIEPGDADAVLRFASSTIQRVASPDLIMPILYALRPLRDNALQRYIELLAAVSGTVNLDRDTVKYILSELSYVLSNYGDRVRGYAWSLVYAIIAYADLLGNHFGHFNIVEVRDMVGKVVDLLKELGEFNSSLGVIAWAYALAPALEHEDMRRLMEEKLGIDAVNKASEVLEELNDKKERVQELMGDKEFMSYIESWFVKADENAVKVEILEATSFLKDALAIYRLNSDELDEAKKLFNELAKERKEIGDYRNYLVARGWALRVEAIQGSLDGTGLTKLVDEFRQLYEEVLDEERFLPTAGYLSFASATLSEYLVSLALMGYHETINKLHEEYLWVLNANKQVSVLTRLMLNALLCPRGRLSSELKGKLSVNPEELIDASLVRLIVPLTSMTRLALMLHALINGNKELAKAIALDGATYSSSKLLRRLYLEAYKACCDLESESFRLALARLFFYHV